MNELNINILEVQNRTYLIEVNGNDAILDLDEDTLQMFEEIDGQVSSHFVTDELFVTDVLMATVLSE